MNDKYNLISLLNPFTLNSVINAGKLKMENRVFFLFKSTVPFQNHKKLMKKIYQKHKIASQKFFSLTSALLSSTLSSFFHQSAAVTINSLPCETNENSAAWVPGRNGLPKGSLDLIHCKYAQYSSSSIYRGPCSRFMPFPVKHKTFFSKKYLYSHICPIPPAKIPLYSWVVHL